MTPMKCAVCGHDASDHCQEREVADWCDSKRELCLRCPGYVDEFDNSMYPRGQAWHRFKPNDSTQSES